MISSLSKVGLLRSNINDNLRHCSCFTVEPTCSINNYQRRTRSLRSCVRSWAMVARALWEEHNSSMKIHVSVSARRQIIFKKSICSMRTCWVIFYSVSLNLNLRRNSLSKHSRLILRETFHNCASCTVNIKSLMRKVVLYTYCIIHYFLILLFLHLLKLIRYFCMRRTVFCDFLFFILPQVRVILKKIVKSLHAVKTAFVTLTKNKSFAALKLQIHV